MSRAMNQLKKIDIDKVLSMDLNALGKYLTEELGIFVSVDDIKLFIVENASETIQEDEKYFPLYYPQLHEEEVNNEFLDTTDEMLTDEYIKREFNK